MHLPASHHSRKPLRLLAATLVLAVASGVTLTASAEPFDGPGGPGGRPMGHMGPGHDIGRMLDSVNATADQRAQIKAIMDAARADMKTQHAASRALHDQSEALFAQPNVDARAAESLRQQMLAQHDAASKRALQVKLDISRVLTADQRKMLSDRMAQRRTLMDRQRTEREALDKTAR